MDKVAQTSILNQIRRTINRAVYENSSLDYSVSEFNSCFEALEHVHDALVDDADLVWSYIFQTVSGWMPSPGGVPFVYNSPEYNARELFVLSVRDLAREALPDL